MNGSLRRTLDSFGGIERTRIPDPQGSIQALSPLSYSPTQERGKRIACCSQGACPTWSATVPIPR